MQDNQQPVQTIINDWTFRIRQPRENRASPNRIMLLLHGHLGNENSMWILTNPLPQDYILLAPRAPLKLGEDQYSWHKVTPAWPDLDQYQIITDELLARVAAWQAESDLSIERYDLMGFSQGAVLAYALSILHPKKIRKVAALAGFIPQSWQEKLSPGLLKDKEFYISHGKRDQIVPLSQGRKAAHLLQESGAEVLFCEANSGHKLSVNCFKGLGTFFGQPA